MIKRRKKTKKASLALLLNLAVSELECSGYLTPERKALLIAEARDALAAASRKF